MSAVAERTRQTALPLHWRQSTVGEYFAEAFGCFILIALGDGVVAMLWALIGSGRSSAGALQSSGDWLLITLGWFFAVMLAVYTVGGITGAHINPAITLGQAIRGNFTWRKGDQQRSLASAVADNARRAVELHTGFALIRPARTPELATSTSPGEGRDDRDGAVETPPLVLAQSSSLNRMVRDRSTLPVPTSRASTSSATASTASRPIRQDWTFTRHAVQALFDRLDQWGRFTPAGGGTLLKDAAILGAGVSGGTNPLRGGVRDRDVRPDRGAASRRRLDLQGPSVRGDPF